MWKYLLYALCGILSGILGGMGMGGGVILVPALTVFFGVEQVKAQAVNLIAFVPMAIVALFIHIKNGRVKKDGLIYIIVPACVFSVAGSFIANSIDGNILKRIFGGFLLVVAVMQFFSEKITEFIENKLEKKRNTP